MHTHGTVFFIETDQMSSQGHSNSETVQQRHHRPLVGSDYLSDSGISDDLE